MNPATGEKLIRTGSALAAAHDGDLLALSVAVTDAPGAFDSSDPEVESRQAVIDREMAVAKNDENDVPTRDLIRAAESSAAGILDTSEAYDVDCVLLGWHGSCSSEAEVVIGNVVDEVSANTRRDLLVERVTGGNEPVDSVLVPIASGIHSGLAVSTARPRPRHAFHGHRRDGRRARFDARQAGLVR